MNRRRFLAVTGASASLAVAGCLGAGDESTGAFDVEMTIDSYRPEELTVEPGTTVEFGNTSSHAHNVAAFQDAYPDEAEYWSSDPEGRIESEQEAIDDWYSTDQYTKLSTRESFEYTFEHEGRYDYYCVPHIEADMIGAIIVEES